MIEIDAPTVLEHWQQRARKVLARASVVSEGQTYRWNSSGGGRQKPGSVLLFSDGTATYDRVAARIRGAGDDPAKLAAAVEWAEAEVEHQVRRTHGIEPETDQERNQRIVRQHEGVNYRIAARAENMNENTLRSIRLKAGRRQLDGRHP